MVLSVVILSILFLVHVVTSEINHGGLDIEFNNTLILSETTGLVFYWSYDNGESDKVSMALRCQDCDGYFAIGFNDVSTSPPYSYMIGSHAIVGDCISEGIGDDDVATINEFYLAGAVESQIVQEESILTMKSCDVDEVASTLRFSRQRLGANYSLDVFGNQSQTIIYATGFAGSNADSPTYHQTKGIASWPTTDVNVPTSQPSVFETETLSSADCTIIGAGPGGILAADVLSGNAQCNTLRLLERGSTPLSGTYTTLPFFDTFTKQTVYTVANYNGAPLGFAGTFGGQQTTNGGVFSPGSIEDVSQAFDITLTEAAAAQECAALSIEQTMFSFDEQIASSVPNIESQELMTRNGLMAICDDNDIEGSCDWGDMLFAPTNIRRRTVAHRIHGEGIPSYASLNTEVDRIVFTEGSDPLVAEAVIFSDGTISPVASEGKVFLAANALGSAKILARSDTRWTSFSFHNHYHTYSYVPVHAVEGPHKDAWQYEFTTPDVTIDNGIPFEEIVVCPGQRFELDLRGNFPVADGVVQVVLMQMQPELRVSGIYDATTDELILNDEEATQCDIVARKEAVRIYTESWGGGQFSPNFAGFSTSWSQSWHFAGGIDVSTSSKIIGTENVFSSDTGAIRFPFSCHTSMVSAASGIVASMQALDLPITSCLEHISSSSNNPDTVMLSVDNPIIIPSPRQLQIASSGTNELIMLTRTEISNEIEVLAARSYNGYEFDSAPPLLLPVSCDNTIDSSRSVYKTSSSNMSIVCNIAIPEDNFDLYIFKIRVIAREPLSDMYSASRFLSQSSFGATRQSIETFIGDEYSGDTTSFITAQMAEPATLHRAYFRQRANPIQVIAAPISGYARSQCAPGSRWMKYAFDAIYNTKIVVVMDELESSPGMVSLSVGGHIRTIVPFSHMSVASSTTYPITLDICKVTTRVGGKVSLCNSGKSFENPQVQFTAGDPVDSDRVVLHQPLVFLEDIPGDDGDSAILDPSTDPSTLISSCDTAPSNGPLFAIDTNSGDLYIESKRIELIENTLDDPAMSSTQPLCTSAAKTFLNEHSCVPNLDACITQSFSSADVVLNTESLRTFYTLGQKYVYTIKGLQLVEDALNPMDPCNGKRSRWIKDTQATESGCDGWNTKSPFYTQMLQSVIGSSIKADSGNGDIHDLQLSPQVCTNDVLPLVPENESLLGVHILVDSVCWRQSHPNEMNVYDFSSWAVSHPGNNDALLNGRPNPITNPAEELESTFLQFPSWHPIERWDQRGDGADIIFIGRFNETIDFTSLPLALKLPELANYFGAGGSLSYSGSESCGSPGEVANDPSKGHQLKAGYGANRNKLQSTDRPGSSDNDIENTDVQSAVWASVAVRAKDQLRQKVAWILSQVFVINEESIGSKDMSEMYLHYYDIFVRHAFGNYQDIMKEVALSPMMATMLSSIDSKSILSSGYHPDENFAREIMQLFSFGLYKLNENGTRVTDADGLEFPTYTTRDIENFAKVWTGLKRRGSRSNIELQTPPSNSIDPLKINRNYRDHTPKTDLRGGYLGDNVQLCSEMPSKSFLRVGAKYQFMGRNHRARYATVHPDEPISKKPFVPNPSNSSLYATLCNEDEDGNCAYASTVTLSTNLDCNGVECDVDTVRMVAILDDGGFVYYEYVRPACVELEFFENGKTIANSRYGKQANNGETNHLMCANPKSLAATPMCCDVSDQQTNRLGASHCVYESERVSFAKAEARCQQQPGKEPCEWGQSRLEDECSFWKNQYHSYGWMPTPCELSAQVHGDGSINVVHTTPITKNSNIHELDSVELYNVIWNEDLYPTVADGCSNACTVRGDTCVCPTSVETSPVFTDITNLPTRDEIRAKLFIGASAPNSFDTYVKCTLAACNMDLNVSVYSRGGSSSNFLLNMDTIFSVRGEAVADSEIYYSNAKSIVSISGSSYTFRNPPKYNSYTEITERDAEHETNRAFDVYMYHPSTPPFVARTYIQHLVSSNPSPRYVQSVATAFKTGMYGQFGSGRRGDLSATVAAVLMDREARSSILDYDITHGKIRAPLDKFIHMLRALEVVSNPGLDDIRLDDRISQHPYRSPTVFNYFQYDHRPSGPLSQTKLVAPEAQLLGSPELLGYMNYLNKMLDNSDTYSLSLVANEGDSAAVAVEELNVLLLAGRLNPLSRSVIEDAYITELNSNGGSVLSASKASQSLILSSPEFQTTIASSPTQVLRPSMDVDSQIYSQGAKVEATKYMHSSCDSTVYTKAEAYYNCNRDVKCQFLMDHKCWGTQYRLCTNANKIPDWYTSVTSSQSCTLLKPPQPEEPVGTTRPKAIVYLMLAGGADSWNMIVPYDQCEGGKDLYQDYSSYRTNIAVPKADLLPINASNQVCGRFGLHPNLSNLKSMYIDGDVLFIANMGMLVEPLTKEEYNSKSKSVPFSLFAHNIQQEVTQRVDAQSKKRVDGVLGRMFDSLQETKALKTSMYAISNDAIVLQTPSTEVVVQRVSPEGPSSLDGIWRKHLSSIANLSNHVSNSRLSNTWSEKLEEAVSSNIMFTSVLNNINLVTNFGSSVIGKQLSTVATLIKANTETFKDDAIAFFVNLGGFDTHGDNIKFAELMLDVDIAMHKFKNEMKAQGVWEDVIVVQASEFGRSLTSNGKGTDHAWGGNYFIAGGSIKGGQLLGEYPNDMAKSGKDMLSRGRVLPTTSWESVWNAVGQFMDVEEADMDYILPLRSNFDSLFHLEDVFDVTRQPSSSPTSTIESPTAPPSYAPSINPSPAPITSSPTFIPTGSPSIPPTPTPTSFLTDRMLYCGVPTKCEELGGDEVVANMNGEHVVRCCTQNTELNWFDKCLTIEGVFGQTPNECYTSKTFIQAMQICSSYDGGRLCSGEEFKDKCTAGTGCGANTKLAWGCTAFEGTCIADAECCSGRCNSRGTCLDVVDTAQPTLKPSTSPSTSPSRIPTKSPSHSPSNSPTSTPGSCPHNVFNKDICCVEECGTCGGSGCASRPGGGENCCSSAIRNTGVLCIDSDPPCIISGDPTQSPTNKPTSTIRPSQTPTSSPSRKPSVSPSANPTTVPTRSPSKKPTLIPSLTPSWSPSQGPSKTPSTSPSLIPTKGPSISPSNSPTYNPVSQCPHNVFNKDICCAEECGTCGGSGCGSRPGGGANCCSSAIRDTGVLCVNSEPPCIIS